MKKRMMAWLTAALVAGSAWGQDLAASLEIRGLQDFLDTAMALVADTPAEGSPAMLPAMLQPILGVNVLQMVDPHGTIRFDVYEKDGEDEPVFRLSLPVEDPDAFFAKLAEAWTEAEAAEGEEAPAFRKFTQKNAGAAGAIDLAFRGEPGRVCVMSAEDADAALLAKEGEAALDVAGVLAFWGNAQSKLVKDIIAQGSVVSSTVGFEDMLYGLGLQDGDKLEMNILATVDEESAACFAVGETGADVNLVNLPDAIAASVSKWSRTAPQDLERAKQMAAVHGWPFPEGFWNALQDFSDTFEDDTGFALLPFAEGECPKFVAYLTPKNPGEVRKAILDNSSKVLDKVEQWLEMADEGDESPLQLVPGEARTAAGAEIDAYALVLADTEDNREMAEEKGWTLPKELGTIDLAWLDNGAMVVSTLGAEGLDGLLERRVAGALDDLSSGGPCAELFGAGQRSQGMGYVRLVPFMHFVFGYLKELDDDFAEMEEVVSGLPQTDTALAIREDFVDGRQLRESLRVKLPELKEFVMYVAAQMGSGSQTVEMVDDLDEEDDFELDEDAEDIDFDADPADESAEAVADEPAED